MPGRRFALYFSWSRPREIGASLGVLENRYPTLFEFRRAIWPLYEWAADPERYRQDVAGFLDHVVLFDFESFNALVTEETGHTVSVIQREGDHPPVRELDDDLLRNVETLIVVSLDHLRTEQHASQGEIEAIRSFLNRERSCLVVCPHHDVGAVSDSSSKGGIDPQEVQFRHHGDRLVPAQQRIGGFARSLLGGLGLPLENQFGLNPARSPVGAPAPLEIYRDVDRLGVLNGVTTFNLHPHLPHIAVPASLRGKVELLAKQPINLNAPTHPFIEAGNRHFNAFLHVPPAGDRAGNVFVCDATLWSSAFGGVTSLKNLWRNLVTVE